MNQHQQKIVDQCLDQLDKATLDRQQLANAFDAVTGENGGGGRGGRQDLLYIQALESALHSKATGICMLIDGKYAEEPENDEDWPYECVIDALKDGWRVISFPNMALSLDENRTYGLGFEFILERWR